VILSAAAIATCLGVVAAMGTRQPAHVTAGEIDLREAEITTAIECALEAGVTDPREIVLITALAAYPTGPQGRPYTWPPPRDEIAQRRLWGRLARIVRLTLQGAP
jgi:hypothetical protein